VGAIIGMVFCVIGVFLVNWQTAAKQVGAQDSMPGAYSDS
jgi:hypothetical protein